MPDPALRMAPVRFLFRAEPRGVMAFPASSADRRFKRVRDTFGALLRFPEDRIASFLCSFGAAEAGWFELVGTRGRLRLDPAYEYAKPLTHSLTFGGRTRERTFRRRDQFAADLLYFSDCVRKARTPEPSGEEGLSDVRIIRALIRSAETRSSVSLPERDRSQRPVPRQEIDRPPVRKPPILHARAPSRS